jgi:hypothetical protein
MVKLLERLRRRRKESRERWAEQEPERKEAERMRDRFEDEVVSSRSPSLSRLKRW